MKPLDKAMWDLAVALDCGENTVLAGKPWAPTRVQLERLMTRVNGRPPTAAELDEQCERFADYMVRS